MEGEPTHSNEDVRRAALDRLTRYIYQHYNNLLSDEERAADRYRLWRFKSSAYRRAPDDAAFRGVFRIQELEERFPTLLEQIRTRGIAAVMRSAADRVAREHPIEVHLNVCPKCGALCRTPVARQCFDCGYDWHDSGPASKSP